MIIKVCGMRDPENIRRIDGLGIDLMGFIFYDKSSRFAGYSPVNVSTQCRRVGVFVNSSVNKILDIAQAWTLDYIQLHGDESPQMCDIIRGLGYKVIKAISISDHASLSAAAKFEGRADILLFDTKCSGYGGSGQCFDWNILTGYSGHTPFMLSGGLGPDNLSDIKEFNHCQFIGIDLNSKFELSPGIKDVSALEAFIKSINK